MGCSTWRTSRRTGLRRTSKFKRSGSDSYPVTSLFSPPARPYFDQSRRPQGWKKRLVGCGNGTGSCTADIQTSCSYIIRGDLPNVRCPSFPLCLMSVSGTNGIGLGHAAVPPAMNVPVRNYPLPMINEPPMYVVGEKSGQRALPPNAGASLQRTSSQRASDHLVRSSIGESAATT
jgi:hypothetical protein